MISKRLAPRNNLMRKKYDIWTVLSVLVFVLFIIFLAFPLISLLKEAFFQKGEFTLKYFVTFFSKKYYSSTLINSFKVTIAATCLTLAIGIPLAYFYNLYTIKGRLFLQTMIILCSMSAPFIGAYSWILLLGRSGLITSFFSKYLGIQIPSIYGFNGILLVLSLELFPLVFLYVSGALRNIDNSLIEVAENLGCSSLKKFFRIIIPLCAPSILAAALLVFMRAFSDFGTPLLIGEGYRTFTVEIYNQYLGETGGNHNFAASISVIAIIITAAVFLSQKIATRKFSYTMSALNPIQQKKPKRWASILMHIYCYGVVALAFLPQVYVIYTSFKKVSGKLFLEGYSLDSYKLAFERMGGSIQNTFIIGGLALLVIIILGVVISYLVVRRKNFINHTIDTLSMVPYIIPGSVIGIALVTTFNVQRGFLPPLTGGVFIMVLALFIRRSPYMIRSSSAILSQISPSIEEASISLGTSHFKTFRRITVPMMTNGIISGAILCWVTIVTELSTAIILYNARTITLTLSVYTFVTRGNYGAAAAVATILTLFTILSLMLFFFISKDKDIVF